VTADFERYASDDFASELFFVSPAGAGVSFFPAPSVDADPDSPSFAPLREPRP
jgi:hypothetical protein